MLLLLWACTGPSVEPAPELPAEPGPVTGDEEIPAPVVSVWPEGVKALEAADASRPPELPMGVADGVTFYGWSDDGAVWDIRHAGMGGASCDMWAELQVVGPEGVKDTLRFDHPEVEADECTGPNPTAALEEAAPAWLETKALKLGGIGDADAALEVTGEMLLPGDYEAKGGYTLTVAGQTASKDPVDFVWKWAIDEVYWSPDGQRAAVLLERTGMGYEGSYTTYELVVLSL